MPQIIYTLEIVIVCSPQQLCLWSGGHLEHVLVEVLLLLLIVPEPLENELTEVRKIYETLPAIRYCIVETGVSNKGFRRFHNDGVSQTISLSTRRRPQ